MIKRLLLLFRKLRFWRRSHPWGISAGPIFRSIFSEEVSHGTKVNSEISNG